MKSRVYVYVNESRIETFTTLESAMATAIKGLNRSTAPTIEWSPVFDNFNECIVYLSTPEYGKIYVTMVK